MLVSNFLAALWGTFFVIVPLSLLIKPERIQEWISVIEKSVIAYISGIVCFILGTATIMMNNVWEKDWKTLVTVLGWLAVLRGIMFIFWTEESIRFCQKIKDKNWIQYVVFAVLIVGLASTYFGLTGK